MKIELLNVRLAIQKSTVTVDKYGNHKNEWETCYRCYATVSAEAAKEETSAGVIIDESKIDFTVRWCDAAAAVTSTGYRIIFNGELYNILGVDHMSYKHKGDALLQKSYTVDYLTKKTKVNEGEIPQYYVEGNHEAIIDPDVFEMVQREMLRRGKGKKYHSGVHAFSSRIKCGECGCWYGSKVWHSNSKYRKTIWRCNHKYDGDQTCHTPHLTDEEIQAAFLSAANRLLATKKAVIENGKAVMGMLFDTKALEAEQDELLQETQVVSDMVQQCIYENAHVALDQTEYQKRYEGLTERFDKAKARLETVMAEIQNAKIQRGNYEAFLKAFEKLPDELTEFTPDAWNSLVDYATVYGKGDIRFTFKNGQEIKA